MIAADYLLYCNEKNQNKYKNKQNRQVGCITSRQGIAYILHKVLTNIFIRIDYLSKSFRNNSNLFLS